MCGWQQNDSWPTIALIAAAGLGCRRISTTARSSRNTPNLLKQDGDEIGSSVFRDRDAACGLAPASRRRLSWLARLAAFLSSSTIATSAGTSTFRHWSGMRAFCAVCREAPALYPPLAVDRAYNRQAAVQPDA